MASWLKLLDVEEYPERVRKLVADQFEVAAPADVFTIDAQEVVELGEGIEEAPDDRIR